MAKLRLIRRKIYNDLQKDLDTIARYRLLSKILWELKDIKLQKFQLRLSAVQLVREVLQIHKDYPQKTSQVWVEYLNLLDHCFRNIKPPSPPPLQVPKIQKVKKPILKKKKDEELFEEAVNLINGIHPHIHRVRCTANLDYLQLNEVFKGSMHQYEKTYIYGYKNAYEIRRSGLELYIIHTNRESLPHPNLKPLCTIDFINCTRLSFIRLIEDFEEIFGSCQLNVTDVESALDLLCKSPEEVQKLRRIIDRHLYLALAIKKTESYEVEGWNFTRMYQLAGGRKVAQLYERGPDLKVERKNNGTKGWRSGDIDRVRREVVTFGNTSRSDQWGGAYLPLFLKHYSMEKVLGQVFEFRRFRKSYNLDNVESFMQTLCDIKQPDRSIGNYSTIEHRLDGLKRRIIEAIFNFDKMWHVSGRDII